MWFRTQVAATVLNYRSISHTQESLKPGLRHITNILQPPVRFYVCLSSGSYIKTNIHKCIRPFINTSLTRFKLTDTRPEICLIKHKDFHFRKWYIYITKKVGYYYSRKESTLYITIQNPSIYSVEKIKEFWQWRFWSSGTLRCADY